MEYWIWLSQLKGVGPVLQKRLLDIFKTPENIYLANIADLIEVEGIGKSIAEKILKFRVNDVAQIVEKVEKLQQKIVTFRATEYAEVLSCRHSPILFYYQGKLPADRGVAIVGARRCTVEAKRAAEEIASVAASNGVAVISGLAKGVDGYAHTATLRKGGYTMAVLANGVDVCYPKEHRGIYEEILAKGGAVLSAYPPGVRPHPKFFLERNAHIAAWSTDVIVVQAAESSGSLTTAKFALEQGRKLYAVPHSIYLKEAIGSNKLLQRGATIYLAPRSLGLECTARKVGAMNFPRQQLSQQEKDIIAYLDEIGKCSIEALAQFIKQPEKQLHETLMLMEMNNLLRIHGKTILGCTF